MGTREFRVITWPALAATAGSCVITLPVRQVG